MVLPWFYLARPMGAYGRAVLCYKETFQNDIRRIEHPVESDLPAAQLYLEHIQEIVGIFRAATKQFNVGKLTQLIALSQSVLLAKWWPRGGSKWGIAFAAVFASQLC